MKRLWLCCLFLAACSDSGTKTSGMDGGTGNGGLDGSISSSGEGGTLNADGSVPSAYLQYWTGDWGDMILRQVGNEVWGVYNHDEGTVRGTITGTTFTGWWCETPSRLPPRDAGDVIFDFISNGDGTFHIDGRWRYADQIPDGEWDEGWDLENVSDTPASQTLLDRFNDPTAFCLPPDA